jgi:hypothetical protein
LRSIALGAMVMMVVKFSAEVTSGVMPPVRSWFCHSLRLVVRSGLMAVQESPRFVDLCTYWLPK